MPHKPKQPCNHPYCPSLVESGERFCSKHHSQTDEQERERQRRYVSEPHRKAAQAFCKTAKWRKLREKRLRLTPLCAECGKPGNTVDHAISHRQRLSIWCTIVR